jgi:hypothetical protein
MYPLRQFSIPGSTTSARLLASCACAADLQTPAEPGSVEEYHNHVLVRLRPPEGDAAPQRSNWWPRIVERHPLVLRIFRAIVEHRDAIGPDLRTKITAYEGCSSRFKLPDPGKCDLRIFPAGLGFRGLPLEHAPLAIAHALAAGSPRLPVLAENAASRMYLLEKIQLLVCCHEARDERCGRLGPQLAAELVQLLRARGLTDKAEVLQTSHVGGHKVSHVE